MNHYDHKERRTFFIFILIFLLLVMGIVTSGYFSYRTFEQQFRAQVERQLSSIAELKATELAAWRNGRLADAEQIYQNHVFSALVRDYFQGPDNALAGAQIQSWLMSYKVHKEYDHVRLLDVKGQTHITYPLGLPPLSSVVAGHIPEVLQSKQIMLIDFYLRDTDQQIRLSILIPILDPADESRVLGLVAISINPEVYLYPFIEKWPIYSTSAETLLIRREGNDVLFLNNLRFDSNAALALRFPLTETEIPSVKAVMGQTGIVEGVDYREGQVLADLRPVPESPWFLISKMDTVEVYAPLRTRLWQTFGLTGMAILLAGAGLMVVWRQQRIYYYRTQADTAEALRNSEKKYRALVENMQVGVVVHSSDTSIIFSNPMATQLLGLTPDQMRGKTAIDPAWCFIREDGTRAPLEEYPVNRALNSDVPISNLVLGILRPERQEPTWVQCDAHQDRELDGRVRQIVVTFFDITERKQIQDLLSESEGKYRILTDRIADQFFGMDTSLRYTYWNKTSEKETGIAAEDAFGKSLQEVFPDTAGSKIEKFFLDALKIQKSATLLTEYSILGRKKIFEITCYPSLEGLSVFSKDITERKRMEEALRESEEKFKYVFDNSVIGKSITLPSGEINVNKAFCDMLGYSRDELVNRKWQEISHPDDIEITQKIVSSLISGEKESARFTKRYIHKNGSVIWTDVGTAVRRDKDGKPLYFMTTVSDITERKLAEKELYESEERLRRAVLGAPFPIMIHAEDGEVVTINNPWIKLTGYNHSDIPTIADWTQKAYGTRMETVRADIDSLYALDGPKAEGEYTIMTHAGKARIWDFSSAPIGQLPDGRRLVISMAMDVTNRKRAEIELRETNQYLDNLFNYANAPIIVWDPQFKIARFNHAFEELTGRNEYEVLGGALEILFPPNEVESSMELIRKTLTGERWEVVEINILHVDGSIRTVLWNSATLFSAEGRSPMATIAQGQDITKRKRAENMLEARLRLVEFAINHSMDELLTKTLDEVCAITDSSIGFYHFVDPGQKVLSLQAWSTRTMQEYCKAEGKGSHYPVEQAGVWADCVREKQAVIHNDYAALPASHRRGLPEGHAELVRELVVPIMRDDLIVAILGVGNKTQDYTKKDIDTVAYFADVAWEIAERKLAEDSLVRSEKKYRELHESMMDGFVSVDMNGKFLECNEVYRKMLGYSEAELKQLTYLDLTPEKWRQYEAEIVESQIMKRGYSDIYEKEYRRKDGTIFPAELHTILSRDENGNPVNMWAIARDITERKQAERQLAEHAVQLEEVVNERTRELRDTQEQLVRQEKLAILGQLAGSMGHELRNPLGVISNAIYFLKMAQPDASDKIKEYLNIIENEARTSDKIITDLLDFARVKSVDRQPVSVPEVIHQTLNRFPVPPSVELVLTIPFDLPQIFADPHHMVQILGNLTVNACQALPDTGGRLEISAALHHDMVSIAIHDNGTGISPENMNKLFEPLFTTKIKGIGLGLAVSRKLAEANGGRIEVKSEAGQGSTFTIFLPLESREQ